MEAIGRYDGQMELVSLLAEEMGETQHVIGKVLRHGHLSCERLKDGGVGRTNLELLAAEVGDVLAAIEMLLAAGVLRRQMVHFHAASKFGRVREYLHSVEAKNAASRAEVGLASVLFDLADELGKAQAAHRRYNSAHEGYAVLAEEVAELWDEVRKKAETRDVEAMRREALQVATVAVRFILELVPAKRAVPVER